MTVLLSPRAETEGTALYNWLSSESELNVVVGFCGFASGFYELTDLLGTRLELQCPRRNQVAPVSMSLVLRLPPALLRRSSHSNR